MTANAGTSGSSRAGLLTAAPSVTEAWLRRLASPRPVAPGVAAGLPAVVLTCVAAAAEPGADVAEAAYALGAVRAAQGHGPVTVVEDLLALGPLLAGEAAPGDGARLQRVLEVVLRSAVAAHEAERPDPGSGTRDPLSGLLHPAVFTELLEREVAAAARDGAPSLLLVEVDGLAEHLEDAGRLAADLLLVRVAQLLVECSRRSDVLARLADFRLALLLPRTDQLRGLVVARRVLARALTHEHLAPEVTPVELHLGLGWLPDPSSGDGVLAAAQVALQRARRRDGHALEVSRAEDRAVAPAPRTAPTTAGSGPAAPPSQVRSGG